MPSRCDVIGCTMAGDKGYYRFPSDFRYFIGFIGFTQKKKLIIFFAFQFCAAMKKS
jgi:hypothetical protein